jgi:hypothetical protein
MISRPLSRFQTAFQVPISEKRPTRIRKRKVNPVGDARPARIHAQAIRGWTLERVSESRMVESPTEIGFQQGVRVPAAVSCTSCTLWTPLREFYILESRLMLRSFT